MTSESNKWESLKAEYLHKVEKALSSVKHPRIKEVIEDVSSHLDRRFTELDPQEQTWENFQKIITEMGPVSDYAELLDACDTSTGHAVRLKHLWWLALAGVLVVAAILLPRAKPADIAGYIVKFEPAGQFKPVTARQLLEAFNQNHPNGVRTHHFRTQVKDGNLIGYICVDTEAAKNALASMLKKSEKLTLIKATAATTAELEELYKMAQSSISSVVYIVTFEPIGQFKPETARQLLNAFNENYPRGVRTHHFRTEVKGDKLIGYICVDNEEARDAVASMLEKSEKLILIKATAATSTELEDLYKLGQPSLRSQIPGFSTAQVEQKWKCASLLDADTRSALFSFESYYQETYKVKTGYESASENQKTTMLIQWMNEVQGTDWDKAVYAAAALSEVNAGKVATVLTQVATAPKGSNRVKWIAVRALAGMAQKETVPAFINLIDHYNKNVRTYAKVGLAEISGEFFGDSKQKWTEWANSQGIEVKQMDVGPKVDESNQTRRSPRSRLHPAWSRNQTVTRSGPWPDGDCSLYGMVYRKARNSGLGHGKICLSSEEFGSWTVEAQDDGRFDFRYIPAGTYSLRTLETLGYQDTFYDSENKNVEKPTFQLRQGQRKTAHIELKPLGPYHRITGRIIDENGKPIPDHKDFIVCAWAQKPQRRDKEYYLGSSFSLVNEDGSYLLEELDARPVYIQVRDRYAQNKDNPYPPRFYPGTFSRTDAKLVTSQGEKLIENVDIPMMKTGGLVLEGLVTNESTGVPVPEALVSIFHRDMSFDLFCGYTNQQGRYRIEGLGEGNYIVHVDAVYKGLVKTRKYVSIKPHFPTTDLDFTLRPGATISGKFVDDKGNPWKVGQGLGDGRYRRGGFGDATPTFVYGNKYAPSYIRGGFSTFYNQGEGNCLGARMIFPTESSFLLPAIAPGETIIEFYPKRNGERLLKILYQGEDISKTGILTKAEQKIDNVTIVIGSSKTR